jgi:hypothetical protein
MLHIARSQFKWICSLAADLLLNQPWDPIKPPKNPPTLLLTEAADLYPNTLAFCLQISLLRFRSYSKRQDISLPPYGRRIECPDESRRTHSTLTNGQTCNLKNVPQRRNSEGGPTELHSICYLNQRRAPNETRVPFAR